jgi:hypothetical protein
MPDDDGSLPRSGCHCSSCAYETCKHRCPRVCACGMKLFGKEKSLCSHCGTCRACCNRKMKETAWEYATVRTPNTTFQSLRFADGPYETTLPLKFWNAGKGEFTRNPSKRFVSLEIEVCGFRDHGPEVNRAAWNWSASCVGDGSLPDGGIEINTSPANGDLFIRQMREIGAAIYNQEGFVDSRAGMHCHVDARDFSWWDIRKLILLYAKIEEGIYHVVPPWRRGSSYATPCGQYFLQRIEGKYPNPRAAKANKQKLISAVYAQDGTGDIVRHAKVYKGLGNRYRGLNLDSWFHRKTIECRIHQGSTRTERFIAWGMLWAAILDHAMKVSEKEIRAMTGTPDEMLLSIPMPQESRDYIMDRHRRYQRRHARNDEDCGVRQRHRGQEDPFDEPQDEERAEAESF